MKVGFLGAGNIASALIQGMIKSGRYNPDQIMASDISRPKLDSLAKDYGIGVTEDNNELAALCDVLIIAVKPNMVADVLKPLVVKGSKLFISLVSGFHSTKLSNMLPEKTRLIRVIPNTPVLVQQGVTAICEGASEEDLQIAKAVFESVGTVEIVEEKFIDIISAVSSSGPAYFFLVIDAIADAGLRMGLPKNLAITLAAKTAVGAAEMILRTNKHPAILKDQVTSPAGTTIEAIKILEEFGLRAAFLEAIEAAVTKAEHQGNM